MKFLQFLFYSKFLLLCFCSSCISSNVHIVSGKLFGQRNDKKSPITKWEMKKVPKHSLHWVDQPLDHSVPEINHWKQRYFLNLTKYSSDGPVLIYVGGESAIDPRVLAYGELAEHAIITNAAALFVLEHRNATIDSLKYLSVTQALHDLDGFIKHIKGTYGMVKNKIVLYGGSYAGTLVSYYLQLFTNANVGLASSAPLAFVFNYHGYLELTARAFNATSPGDCLHYISDGMRQLNDRLKKSRYQCHYMMGNNGSKSQRCFWNDTGTLRLCTPLDLHKPLEHQSLFSYITQIFIFFAQYHNSLPTGYNMLGLCSTLKTYREKLDGFEALAKIMGEISDYLYQSDCMDYSMDSYCSYISKSGIEDGAVVSGLRQWVWQTCSEIASFPTTTSSFQPFGRGVPPSFFVEQCRCAFGESFKNEGLIKLAVDRHNAKFGGLLTPRPHVIFTNGEFDPVAGLSYTMQHHLPVNKSRNELIIIAGGSHCDDLGVYSPTDSIPLVNARERSLQLIQQWIT